MSDTKALLVMCTASTEKEAVGIAQALVQREQAACVNIVPMIRSVYRWKGKVWNEAEQLLLIKTAHPLFDDVRRTVKELHSYELPEILALPVGEGDEKTLEWIASCVKSGRDNH